MSAVVFWLGGLALRVLVRVAVGFGDSEEKLGTMGVVPVSAGGTFVMAHYIIQLIEVDFAGLALVLLLLYNN